ncbi:MAG: GHKL domain-containing protein [Lachnospiraceae bacterium]|nr:GHKL domain-containing protein [Lachnospiraceae bacterium]
MHRLKIFRSLKLRLFVLILLAGFLPSVVVSLSVLKGYENRAIRVRTLDAQTQLNILANHLLTYHYLADPSSDVVNAELGLLSNLYNGRVMVINQNLKIVKDTYGMSEGKTMVSEEVVKCLKGNGGSTNYDEVNGYIEITVPIIETITAYSATEELPEGTEIIRGVLLTSVSDLTIITTLEILGRRVNTVVTAIVFILLLFAILFSYLLVRPFDRLSRKIGEAEYGLSMEPVTENAYLETERLTGSFNILIDKMRAVDASRSEFVSNVSHELKTPMTSVKILADSLNSQPDAPAELYREFMADITKEIEREDKIINDLLALVKLSAGASTMNITEVNVNELSEIILKRLRPQARKKDVELTLTSNREVIAEADEVKLSLILTNLVENAIKYNREQGRVDVTIDADHQYVTIEVADTGIGIPEEDLEQIYERFYRVDKSHSREIGGTGLGLSITKSCVALHKGVITATSREGEGSTFTVKIPLQYTKGEQG